jgi:hypothetical protein
VFNLRPLGPEETVPHLTRLATDLALEPRS